MKILVTQSCPTLYDPMDYRLCSWNSPGKNTGVVAIPFSRGSSQPRDWTQVSHIAGRFFSLSHSLNWLINVKQIVMRLQGHITLLTKVRPVKAMVFPVVMYGCESWSVKKAERRRIGGFEHQLEKNFNWYWRRLLRVPWTVRRSSQSILKEISPEYSLKGLMLKLKL